MRLDSSLEAQGGAEHSLHVPCPHAALTPCSCRSARKAPLGALPESGQGPAGSAAEAFGTVPARLCLAADHACCAVQQADPTPPDKMQIDSPSLAPLLATRPLDCAPAPQRRSDALDELEGLPHEVAVDMLSFVLLDRGD